MKNSLEMIKLKMKNTSGMAILMVMTAITILSFLLANFTFDTKVNKLKIYNQQDRLQARLNAEAGLNFALAKLKLYKEGRNMIEKNEELKSSIGIRPLESIVSAPFSFPVDPNLLKDADLIQKNAIQELSESIILRGSLLVTLKPLSSFLNPNNLRIQELTEDDSNLSNNENNEEDSETSNVSPDQYMEIQFVETLQKAIDQKIESDDNFANEYSNINAQMLIKELKFFVNDKGNFDEVELGEFEALYSEDNTIPKHAPLNSIDELYLLKGWDDVIVDLIKDRMTVHAVTIIPINEITDNQLKVLFPEINEDDRLEFFKYRDGDKEEEMEPHELKTVEQFKSVLTSELRIIEKSKYEERIAEFEAAGIKLGAAGKIFLVTSTGKLERAEYTLNAYVDMPIAPPPRKRNDNDDNDDNESDSNASLSENNEEELNENEPDDPEVNEGEEKPAPLQLMDPRVIELRVK